MLTPAGGWEVLTPAGGWEVLTPAGGWEVLTPAGACDVLTLEDVWELAAEVGAAVPVTKNCIENFIPIAKSYSKKKHGKC